MLIESLVYKAAVSQTPSQISKYYYGTCKETFKERYNNHTDTFRNKSKQTSTEFSKHIWRLKGSSIQYQIIWDIASRACLCNGCPWKYNPRQIPLPHLTPAMSSSLSSLNADIWTKLLWNASKSAGPLLER